MVDTLQSFAWNNNDLKECSDTYTRKKRAESQEEKKRKKKQGNILTDNVRGTWLNGSIKDDLYFESDYWKSYYLCY